MKYFKEFGAEATVEGQTFKFSERLRSSESFNTGLNL